MNGDLIEVELEDGTSFAALATVFDGEEEEVASGPLSVKLKTVAESVSLVADEFIKRARKAAPTEVEMKVKIGFSIQHGKAVALLVDGAVDGAIELKMTWKEKKPK